MRILGCLIRGFSLAEQSLRLSNTALSSRVSFQRVGLPPVTCPDSFQFFGPKTELSKAQLLSWVSGKKKEHTEGESRVSFTTYVDRKQLGLSHTGGPVKAIPALWSDTLYFPCLPTSFQLKESEREL